MRPPGKGHGLMPSLGLHCGGGRGAGTQKMASNPLGPPTLPNHILCPDAPSPWPSNLSLQSRTGQAQSVGAEWRWRPRMKATERAEGHLVCPFGDSLSYFPPSSPPCKLPLGLSGGNLHGRGILRDCSHAHHTALSPHQAWRWRQGRCPASAEGVGGGRRPWVPTDLLCKEATSVRRASCSVVGQGLSPVLVT